MEKAMSPYMIVNDSLTPDVIALAIFPFANASFAVILLATSVFPAGRFSKLFHAIFAAICMAVFLPLKDVAPMGQVIGMIAISMTIYAVIIWLIEKKKSAKALKWRVMAVKRGVNAVMVLALLSLAPTVEVMMAKARNSFEAFDAGALLVSESSAYTVDAIADAEPVIAWVEPDPHAVYRKLWKSGMIGLGDIAVALFEPVKGDPRPEIDGIGYLTFSGDAREEERKHPLFCLYSDRILVRVEYLTATPKDLRSDERVAHLTRHCPARQDAAPSQLLPATVDHMFKRSASANF